MVVGEKKKRSCANCRKIKRKCDGENPCSSCVKRKTHCDYSTTDKRSQRFSVSYIKSLETNNELLETALAELAAFRDDPEELVAKLASLSTSLPKKIEKPETLPGDSHGDDVFEPDEDENSDKAFISEKDQYFGAGSVYSSIGAPTQKQEPILGIKPEPMGPKIRVITLEEDYNYVAGLVRGFFNDQAYGTCHSLFDKNRVLHELENRNLSGPFLNPELIYAICANCESITHKEADAYCDYAIKSLFSKSVASSIATSQCYSLLAIHCISKGQVSKSWLFSGVGPRVGQDVGFDMCHGENPCPISNRCFMSTLIIDQYLSLSLGRRSSLQQNSVPVLRLEGESDADYLSMKHSVELLELTRHMIRSTYQPVTFDKDPKMNYLLKFNRSKVFNTKMLKWRQSLDPACYWSYASLKASQDLANGNHTLKFLYYYFLLFLNKPFLHLPKEHSNVFLIEEMAKEVYLIVNSRLLKIDEENGTSLHNNTSLSTVITSNKNSSASMDICVVMILANVLMILITTQPEHYLYLEKYLKAFAHYSNYVNLRKYDAVEKPMTALLENLENFKANLKTDTSQPGDKFSPATAKGTTRGEPSIATKTEASQHEDKFSEQEKSINDDEQNSEVSTKSSPPTSDCTNSDQQNYDSDYPGKSYLDAGMISTCSNFPQVPDPSIIAPSDSSVPSQSQDSVAFDPWWQNMNNHGNSSRGPNHSLLNEQNQFQPQNPIYSQFSPMQSQAMYGVSQGNPNQPLSAHNQQPAGLPVGHHAMEPYAMQGVPRELHAFQPSLQQQEIYSYDHLPKSNDPVDQMFNSLFSNTGREFSMDREFLNWDGLFKGQYQEMHR
ncbi:hypothetical protein JCM33374_g2120 [Metschnikowia sp. JCM 33374]|nr:hypothetical protein JCM33374_g2120 [Metschnikowia sp. JCM 33374]